MKAVKLRPFVPSGEDFPLAARFPKTWDSSKSTTVRIWPFSKWTSRSFICKITRTGRRAIHLIDPAGVLWHITEWP